MMIRLYLGGSIFPQEGYLLFYRELETSTFTNSNEVKLPEAVKMSYHPKDSPDEPDIANEKPTSPPVIELVFRPNSNGLYVCML